MKLSYSCSSDRIVGGRTANPDFRINAWVLDAYAYGYGYGYEYGYGYG